MKIVYIRSKRGKSRFPKTVMIELSSAGCRGILTLFQSIPSIPVYKYYPSFCNLILFRSLNMFSIEWRFKYSIEFRHTLHEFKNLLSWENRDSASEWWCKWEVLHSFVFLGSKVCSSWDELRSSISNARI